MRQQLVWWEVRGAFLVSCLLSFGALGCGDDSGTALACGDGTARQSDKCLPVDAGSAYSGKDSGSTDQPADAGAALQCGDGTIKVGGKCVVDPASTLKCGDGTLPVSGKCEIEPSPPIEGLVISQLSIRNRGQLVSDGSKIHEFYPVEVSIGVTYKGNA